LRRCWPEASLRSLVGSILTAGLTQGALDIAQVGAVTPGATFGQNFANAAQTNLIKAAIKVGVSTTIEGQALDQSLISALRLAAADTLGQVVASEIGVAAKNNQTDKAAQLIAHAALGCATGAIAAGDCVGGAGGAVAGEVTAQVMLADWTKQQIASLSAGGSTWTQSEVNAELSRLKEEFRDVRSKGVDIAALAGGMAALLLGGSVNTGAKRAATPPGTTRLPRPAPLPAAQSAHPPPA